MHKWITEMQMSVSEKKMKWRKMSYLFIRFYIHFSLVGKQFALVSAHFILFDVD